MRRMMLRLPDIPDQWDQTFLQGMIDRMAQGYYRYGHIKDEKNRDFERTLLLRLKRYLDTGNTEWLMDCANFCMIEFMHPRHAEAHFRATESSESPGIFRGKEIDPTRRHNREI